MGRGRWVGIVAAAALLLNVAAAHASQIVTITIPDKAGEIPSKWLGYSGPPRANVLLPTGYNPAKAYPLLVLLHGLSGNYNQYAEDGIQQTLSGLDAIVVMPEGASGWYTDWWNDGTRGGPSWESYELNEVVPAILAHYKIRPQRRYHAIAGISMGGLGATYLGGRLPGFFGSVATLSGFVDPPLYGYAAAEGEPITAEAPLEGDFDFDAVEGPPNGFYATGHNPTALVDNLKQSRVFESTGTGIPSSVTFSNVPAGSDGLASGTEGVVLEGGIIYPMNRAFHKAGVAAGLDLTSQVHPGGHDLPDFDPELKAMLAWGLFKPVLEHSTSWTNQTVATSGQLWNIGYKFTVPPTEVVKFTQAGRKLKISAAGSPVTITTGGCVINTVTPANLTLPWHPC
jgi:S-formylglutathione hydrolase FrmB